MLPCVFGFHTLRLAHPTRTLHISRIIQKASEQSDSANLSLQSTDLLTLYRGLVARGDIEYDGDQVRAVMRLRRLTRELQDYVPNLISGHAAPVVSPGSNWWSQEKGTTDPDTRALLVRKDIAREFAELDTPKGPSSLPIPHPYWT
ncbi:hypothetical protein FRC08_010921 [Ceratobasidium sp. 394]|nr:hypothetical protein FRC08_010921 [Ceratobasidium sp. 394]